MPSSTRRSPRKTRHLHPSGKTEVMVMNVRELEGLGKDVAIRIGRVGMKSKIEIANAAHKIGLRVLNADPKKLSEKFRERIKKKTAVKKAAKKPVAKKKKEPAKKESEPKKAKTGEEKQATYTKPRKGAGKIASKKGDVN